MFSCPLCLTFMIGDARGPNFVISDCGGLTFMTDDHMGLIFMVSDSLGFTLMISTPLSGIDVPSDYLFFEKMHTMTLLLQPPPPHLLILSPEDIFQPDPELSCESNSW